MIGYIFQLAIALLECSFADIYLGKYMYFIINHNGFMTKRVKCFAFFHHQTHVLCTYFFKKDLSFCMSRRAKTLDNGPFLLKQLISIPVFYLANNVEECFAFNNTLPIIVAYRELNS